VKYLNKRTTNKEKAFNTIKPLFLSQVRKEPFSKPKTLSSLIKTSISHLFSQVVIISSAVSLTFVEKKYLPPALLISSIYFISMI
jgi:hypothetical protein